MLPISLPPRVGTDIFEISLIHFWSYLYDKFLILTFLGKNINNVKNEIISQAKFINR